MNIGILQYAAAITGATGPDEGPNEQIRYSAAQVNTSDPIRVDDVLPRRDHRPGEWVRKAFIGKPCLICQFRNEVFLVVEEADASTECNSTPAPGQPPVVSGENGEGPPRTTPIDNPPPP